MQGHPDLKVAVRANLVGVEPEPANIELGMKVRLRARAARKDKEGNDVVIPEFVPI